MGSDEPGMAAIDCVWITPLVRGAGSGLACAGGTAAAACAITDRVAGAAGRTRGGAGGSPAGAPRTAPLAPTAPGRPGSPSGSPAAGFSSQGIPPLDATNPRLGAGVFE